MCVYVCVFVYIRTILTSNLYLVDPIQVNDINIILTL